MVHDSHIVGNVKCHGSIRKNTVCVTCFMYCSKSNLTLYTYLNCHKSVSNCAENLRVVNFEKTNPPIVKDVFLFNPLCIWIIRLSGSVR